MAIAAHTGPRRIKFNMTIKSSAIGAIYYTIPITG